MLCWFLPHINMNQPQIYICPLYPEPPSHFAPHPPLQVVTEYLVEFPESYSKFPLAIYKENSILKTCPPSSFSCSKSKPKMQEMSQWLNAVVHPIMHVDDCVPVRKSQLCHLKRLSWVLWHHKWTIRNASYTKHLVRHSLLRPQPRVRKSNCCASEL